MADPGAFRNPRLHNRVAIVGARTSLAAMTLKVGGDRFEALIHLHDREVSAMMFVKESRIGASPSRVFAFHESPGALERLSPPWEDVEVESGGDSIRPGARVVLKTRIGPIPVRWVAEHVDYEPPHLFSDRQVSGPFAAWFHRHRMIDDGQGGTILRDEVDYQPPFGWLGRTLAGGYLRRKLGRMFDYRHEITRKIVETDGGHVRL